MAPVDREVVDREAEPFGMVGRVPAVLWTALAERLNNPGRALRAAPQRLIMDLMFGSV